MRAIQRFLRTALAALRDLFTRSPAYRRLVLVSVVLICLTAFLPWWKVFPEAHRAPFIPLHYNIYFGVDQFGPWYQLFAPAVLGLVILCLNIAGEAFFFQHERILSVFFAWLTVLIQCVLLVATVFMVLLNV